MNSGKHSRATPNAGAATADIPDGSEGNPLPVGFTVLRTGRGDQEHAALVTPYCGQIKHVDFVNNEVHIHVNDTTVTLRPIPRDLRDLIVAKPQNVMLVSVDTLSRVRQATSLGAAATH